MLQATHMGSCLTAQVETEGLSLLDCQSSTSNKQEIHWRRRERGRVRSLPIFFIWRRKTSYVQVNCNNSKLLNFSSRSHPTCLVVKCVVDSRLAEGSTFGLDLCQGGGEQVECGNFSSFLK
jgi:hypothetical protein